MFLAVLIMFVIKFAMLFYCGNECSACKTLFIESYKMHGYRGMADYFFQN